MSKKHKNLAEKQDDLQLKKLIQGLATAGVSVRREELARGAAFRAKSGKCIFGGKNILFIDRRLPTRQQVSILNDYAKDFGI